MSSAAILIVEDEKTIALELRERLEALGYQVLDVARSSSEAIKKIEKLHPHILLTNLRFMGLGRDTPTEGYIREYQDTPIVYVVDRTSQATIRRAGTTGPFGYIFRPFDDKQIFATIETARIRHQLESKLRQSRQWLNTTLTSIGDGVIATDEQGLVRFINPIAMEHTGWQHAEAIERPLADVFVFLDENSHVPIDVLGIQNQLPEMASQQGFQGLLRSKNGTLIPVEANITSIKEGRDKIYGMVLVFRDVSQQREAMQEIRHQASRAEALMQVASQLNSQLELETVLNTICNITNRAIQATGTAVVLQDARRTVFRDRAIINLDPAWNEFRETRFEFPKEVLQDLLSREESVVVIQDFHQDFQPAVF